MSEQGRPTHAKWRDLLNGTHTDLVWARRLLRHIPSEPRCKLCLSPQSGVGAPLVALFGFGKYPRNPQLCNNCFRMARRWPGGAEIEITALFADVRGSTGLAETMSSAEYSNAVEDYVRTVSRAVRGPGGIVEKLLGDGVMALFIPAMVGGETAAPAIAAARRILGEVSLPVGVGIHTGPAWVGFVGGIEEVLEFTALGDAVNVASRLGSDAKAGEILMSAATGASAGLATVDMDARRLELRGRSEPMDILSERVSPAG
jgi:adenylate cyclase